MSSKLFHLSTHFNSYKLIIFLLSILSTSALISTKSLAQEASYCFMVNNEGKFINLDLMCGVSKPAAPTSSTSPTVLTSTISVQPQVQKNAPEITQEKLDVFAYSYAQAYCDWREAGGRSREESKSHATKELTNTIIQVFGIDGESRVLDKLDINFFKKTGKFIQDICPKDK